jgi:hypothetical protein
VAELSQPYSLCFLDEKYLANMNKQLHIGFNHEFDFL